MAPPAENTEVGQAPEDPNAVPEKEAERRPKGFGRFGGMVKFFIEKFVLPNLALIFRKGYHALLVV